MLWCRLQSGRGSGASRHPRFRRRHRALAPLDRVIDQGIDKLFPTAADAGTTSANAALAQSAAAAAAALGSLTTAATIASGRCGGSS